MKNPVLGQEKLQKTLFHEIMRGQLPHALLFCGQPGCGKLALALAYAGSLLCQHKTEEGERCGQCPSCKMIDSYAHPDLHFVFPVLKPGSNISDDKISSWREQLQHSLYFDLSDWVNTLKASGNANATIYTAENQSIQRKMSLKPAMGVHKVMIICWPERMMPECANKLLKLIEEPPVNSHFLFVSDEPSLILPTLLSRMQRIDIQRIPQSALQSYLIKNENANEVQAEETAHLANGSLTKALKILYHEDDNTKMYLDLFITLMRASWKRDVKAMRQWSIEVSDMRKEVQQDFIDYCLHLIRENFMYNFHIKTLNSMTADEANFAVRFAPFVNERNVIQLADMLERCYRDLVRQVNAKMVFFDMTLQLSVLIRK